METKKVILELTDHQITRLKHALRSADQMDGLRLNAHGPIFTQVAQQFPRNHTCSCELCDWFTPPYLKLQEENQKIRYVLWRAVALNVVAVLGGIALILL